jgi:hypothetical protein
MPTAITRSTQVVSAHDVVLRFRVTERRESAHVPGPGLHDLSGGTTSGFTGTEFCRNMLRCHPGKHTRKGRTRSEWEVEGGRIQGLAPAPGEGQRPRPSDRASHLKDDMKT